MSYDFLTLVHILNTSTIEVIYRRYCTYAVVTEISNRSGVDLHVTARNDLAEEIHAN